MEYKSNRRSLNRSQSGGNYKIFNNVKNNSKNLPSCSSTTTQKIDTTGITTEFNVLFFEKTQCNEVKREKCTVENKRRSASDSKLSCQPKIEQKISNFFVKSENKNNSVKKVNGSFNDLESSQIKNSDDQLCKGNSLTQPTPCCSYSNENENKKRKRRSTLNEKEFSEPKSKRSNIMETSAKVKYIPFPSTSSYLHSTSTIVASTSSSYSSNNYVNEVVSVPSSIGSSSFTSSPCAGSEFEEIFTRSEIDIQSSSSYFSNEGEFDFSSDESTLVSNTSQSICESNNNVVTYSNDNEIRDQYKSHVTPHKQRLLTPSPETRPCPLPALSWANASDIWNTMCKNDEKAALDRTSSMLENHCGLQPRMRAILLDWLIEVCEVYKLHRETYYLAVDYLDRYLSTQKNVQKTHLQLTGITCLFVAAKVEEIYPPKINEFAYVTDGACTEEDILQHELLLLSALKWSITPVTVMGWLGVYMQLNVNNRSAFQSPTKNSNDEESSSSSSSNYSSKDNKKENLSKRRYSSINNNCIDDISSQISNRSNFDKQKCSKNKPEVIDDSFIYPQFSGFEFSQTAQLIDLCTLDLGLADFPYSVIAATAMAFTFGRETALKVSGYDWGSLSSCYRWMEPFFDVIKEEAQFFFLTEQNEQVQSKHGLGQFCPKITTDDSHLIQSHTTSIQMLEKAFLRREHLANKPESSPLVKVASYMCSEVLLTPPASNRKPNDNITIIENNPADLKRIHT